MEAASCRSLVVRIQCESDTCKGTTPMRRRHGAHAAQMQVTALLQRRPHCSGRRHMEHMWTNCKPSAHQDKTKRRVCARPANVKAPGPNLVATLSANDFALGLHLVYIWSTPSLRLVNNKSPSSQSTSANFANSSVASPSTKRHVR